MFDSNGNRFYDLILNFELLPIDPDNYHETKRKRKKFAIMKDFLRFKRHVRLSHQNCKAVLAQQQFIRPVSIKTAHQWD